MARESSNEQSVDAVNLLSVYPSLHTFLAHVARMPHDYDLMWEQCRKLFLAGHSLDAMVKNGRDVLIRAVRDNSPKYRKLYGRDEATRILDEMETEDYRRFVAGKMGMY